EHDGSAQRSALQQAIQQRRVARAEEAGQDGKGNGLCGGPQIAAGAHFFLASVLLGSGLASDLVAVLASAFGAPAVLAAAFGAPAVLASAFGAAGRGAACVA